MDIMDMFPERVSPEPNSGCWLWTGAQTSAGYGVFRNSGKNHYAHRCSCSLAYGEMLEGQLALHKCDNPSCVNPDHLEIGTKSKNSLDAFARGLNVSVKGEAHRCARLNADDIAYIRGDHGEPLKDMARRFGVSISHIKSIRCRAKWRHVA